MRVFAAIRPRTQARRKMSQAPEVQDIPLLKTAVERCRKKLLKFFDKSTFESEYYFFATVLDPRYKLLIFENNPDLFGDDWIDDCKRSLIETLQANYDFNDEINATVPNVPSKRSASEMDDWDRQMQAMLPEHDGVGVSAEEYTYFHSPTCYTAAEFLCTRASPP